MAQTVEKTVPSAGVPCLGGLLPAFKRLDARLKRRTAEALAMEMRVPVLRVDIGRIPPMQTDFEQAVRLVLREAWFRDALLYLEHVDAPLP